MLPCGVELHAERALGLVVAQGLQRIIRHLAGFRVKLADILVAEIRIPGVSIRIDDHVVGQRFLAGEIVFRDDHVGGAALRARQALELKPLVIRVVDAGLDQKIGGGVDHVGRDPRALAAGTALEEELRAGRHAFGCIAAHAGEHGLPLLGGMHGAEHPLQRVAADAIGQERFHLIAARRAHDPFAVGELAQNVVRLGELDVGARRAAGGDIDFLRARKIVTGGADGDGVVAGR